MEAMFNFIPAPIALVLMLIGFAALAVGAIGEDTAASIKTCFFSCAFRSCQQQ